MIKIGSLTKNLPCKWVWTRRDLNPRPPPCQGGDLPLIYEPESVTKTNFSK